MSGEPRRTMVVPGLRGPARSRPAPSDVSVVIVTWRRPGFVRTCLESLAALAAAPGEVIVVDASEDDATALVCAAFPDVDRLAFPGGAGHMTTARNAGLRVCRGDVVAFLDDDVEVGTGWLTALCDAFADEDVDAVGGRTRNDQPGEETEGVHEIGRLRPDGRLTGWFAADPGGPVSIDHGIGANMSFRIDVLRGLGGFRDDYPGTALREDADAFLRITGHGGRAVFCPSAVVDHRAAPHVRGRRFGFRYQFWGMHNHALLLARHAGYGSTMFRRWWLGAAAQPLRERDRPTRWLLRVAVTWAGLLAGVVTVVRSAGLRPADPRTGSAR